MIGASSASPNASRNASRLETGPSTRSWRGLCGSIPASVRWSSGLMFARQSVALARKNRCAGVRPSISGASAATRAWARWASASPPRSAMFSPSVSGR